MLMAALVSGFIGLALLPAAIITYNTILAQIVIALAAAGLLLLAGDWLMACRGTASESTAEGDLVKSPGPAWPRRVVWGFRALAGIAAIVVSEAAIVTSEQRPDPALHWALFFLGVFILVHLLIESIVVCLPHRASPDKQRPDPLALAPIMTLERDQVRQSAPIMIDQGKDPYKTVANLLATTPGVVLGLLAVFGNEGTLTTVVKVAALALATALLLGIVLNGLVSMQDINEPPRSTVIKLIFNLSLWALVLGVLGVAMGIVYRT